VLANVVVQQLLLQGIHEIHPACHVEVPSGMQLPPDCKASHSRFAPEHFHNVHIAGELLQGRRCPKLVERFMIGMWALAAPFCSILWGIRPQQVGQMETVPQHVSEILFRAPR